MINSTDITKARVLLYKPRNTEYRVMHLDVKIKQPDGSWKLGCMYTSRLTNDDSIYTRTYEMFDKEKWEILK